jgi:hypothetical protein
MGRRPLTFTAEKPIPAAQVAPSSANVVWFNNRGRLLANFKPHVIPAGNRPPLERPIFTTPEAPDFYSVAGIALTTTFTHCFPPLCRYTLPRKVS